MCIVQLSGLKHLSLLFHREQEAKDNVVQAKQTRSASRQLGTQGEATLQQLAQLENSSALASTQLTSEVGGVEGGGPWMDEKMDE